MSLESNEENIFVKYMVEYDYPEDNYYYFDDEEDNDNENLDNSIEQYYKIIEEVCSDLKLNDYIVLPIKYKGKNQK